MRKLNVKQQVTGYGALAVHNFEIIFNRVASDCVLSNDYGSIPSDILHLFEKILMEKKIFNQRSALKKLHQWSHLEHFYIVLMIVI